MNMTLSKRGDYVMRSAIALARAYERGMPRKIREVVADTEVPRTFASQILADLVRAGLAVSRAGRDGGYRLSRPPEQISVLDVVEAAEGPLRAERCALGEGPCRWEAVCPLHETWSKATTRLAELLSTTSLAEIADRDAAIEQGRYAVPLDAHRSHPRAVELSDHVHVEVPALAVRAALGTRHNWSTLVGAAVHEVGAPASGAARPPALVAECTLGPATPGVEADQPSGYLLAWRLSGAGGASRFEGDLSVAVVDAERCELAVRGVWHEERAEETVPTAAALEDRSRRILRGVLRRLARTIEERHATTTDPAPTGAGRVRR